MAATPTTGVAAPAGGRASHGQQPLACALQLAPFAGDALQASVPACGCCSCGLATADYARRRHTCELLLLNKGQLGWLYSRPKQGETLADQRSNASIDIDGIMAVGVMWMPFSYSFLRSWAVDPRSSSGKTFSIMVRSSVRSWK
ncbi:hypothetical protein BHM03_00036784 [Ensete ventricosum]|nr:hypothetical protein BHM03_00036784 [Ensete ventricosum]